MKTVTVTMINGKAKIETAGFSGEECIKETAAMERALGDVDKITRTPEYNRPQAVKNPLRVSS